MADKLTHMAAQAVFELYAQTETGRFHLADIEAPLLDALESLLAAELQDRDRNRTKAEAGESPNIGEVKCLHQ